MQEIEILNGIPKIIDNAKALLDDANLLYENKRFERAYSVYQLSIEEIAKAFFLLTTILFDDLTSEKVQKKLKDGIVSHKIKARKSIGLDSMLNLIIKESNMEVYEIQVLKSFKEFDNINELNNKKNYSLYTSLIDGCFMSPCELINKEDVDKIRIKASIRITFGEALMKPIIIRIDQFKLSFKQQSIDKEFQKKLSQEQVEEIIRIRNKYNIK
jgi:AbiV family abortive infection protein